MRYQSISRDLRESGMALFTKILVRVQSNRAQSKIFFAKSR